MPGRKSYTCVYETSKPRTLPPWASDLAQTTNTSAIGLFEIQVLAPFST
jgi:hypothetical protein